MREVFLSGARLTQASWEVLFFHLMSQGSERDHKNTRRLDAITSYWWKTACLGGKLQWHCSFVPRTSISPKVPLPWKVGEILGVPTHAFVILVFGASVNVKEEYWDHSAIIWFSYLHHPHPFYIISWLPPHPSRFCCFSLYYSHFKSVSPLGWKVI